MLSRIVLMTSLLGLAAPASAQIYSWRDANGNLVLSNRRTEAANLSSTRSYAVPKAESVRATRYAAVERSPRPRRVQRRPGRRRQVRPKSTAVPGNAELRRPHQSDGGLTPCGTARRSDLQSDRGHRRP